MFFAHGTENKVGVLFGHVFEFGLGTVEESFSHETARTDSNFRLIHVITRTQWSIFHVQQYFDTYLLVWFQYFFEQIIGRKTEDHRAYGKQHQKPVFLIAVEKFDYQPIEARSHYR